MSYLAVSFALGIWAADIFPLEKIWIGILLAILIVLNCFLRPIRWLSALILLGCFSLLGAFRSVSYNNLPKDHYSYYIESSRRVVSRLRITALGNVTAKHFRYIARVDAISHEGAFAPTNGLILLQVKRNLTVNQWPVGIELWAEGKWIDIPEEANSFQFDYRKYLLHKGIHHQLYILDYQYIKLRETENFRNRINVFKTRVVRKLRKVGYAEQELMVFRALLLGDRTEMDPNLSTRYVRAGAMHFLAISGLHAGIIFSIMYLLPYGLVWWSRSRVWRILCALAVLWCFAFFVDFSASVSRASLMLTIYYIFILMRRRSDLYHTLALSALILLAICPGYLFDVGFQLSYLAVFFIRHMYEVFRFWLHSKNLLGNYFLSLLSMTLAAQLGTTPVTLYYFHCFPMLFLLSSLVITPLMFLLLTLGILILILIALNVQALWLMEHYKELLLGVNIFVDGLASWQWEPWNRISISFSMVILMYVGIAFLRIFLKSGRGKWMLGVGIAFLSVLHLYVWDVYEKWKKKEVVVFQNFDKIVGVKVQDTLDLYLEDISKVKDLKHWLLEPYVVEMRIVQVNYFPLDEIYFTPTYLKTKNIIHTDQFKLLIVDSLWKWKEVPWKNFNYILMKKPARSSDMEQCFFEKTHAPSTNNQVIYKRKDTAKTIFWITGKETKILPF